MKFRAAAKGRSLFRLAAAVLLVALAIAPQIATAEAAAHPETRDRLTRLADQVCDQVDGELSRLSHLGYRDSYDENVVGSLLVPESGLSRGAQLRSQLGGLSRADRQARISALVSENQLRLQNLGRGASSRVLGRNLQAVGTLRPTGSAAHHIVAGRSLYAVSARRMLRRAGVDINEAANGVFLPRLRATRTLSPSAYHPSLHTRRYYTEVTRRLRGVRGRDEALEVLEQIRTDLLGGRFPN
jgi:hypothetical protein